MPHGKWVFRAHNRFAKLLNNTPHRVDREERSLVYRGDILKVLIRFQNEAFPRADNI